MPGSWNPIHENHAIDAMAALVTFSGTIPNLLLAKALKRSEDVAFDAGLRSRGGMAGFQMVIGAEGVSSGATTQTRGRTFNSIIDDEETPLGSSRRVEQLVVTENQVAYRTWNYVSWTWQIERMRMLMSPAISMVQDAVSLATQRLEYLDRFRYDGDLSEMQLTSLLRAGSPFVAPHVFSGAKARRGRGSVMTRANVEGNYVANLRVRAEHQNRVEDFRILIVEDHVVIAADIADAVQRSGGQVLGPVSRLSEALAVIATVPCDAALLDINLGHETSYLAAEMLQAREVPFAFLTGSEGDEIESRYANIPVLRKPFSEMEIESCLQRLMASSGMPAL